jgi:hypothetical protein
MPTGIVSYLQQRAAVARAVRFMFNLNLGRAYQRWLQMVSEKIEQREAIANAVKFMINIKLGRAFARWTEMVTEAQPATQDSEALSTNLHISDSQQEDHASAKVSNSEPAIFCESDHSAASHGSSAAESISLLSLASNRAKSSIVNVLLKLLDEGGGQTGQQSADSEQRHWQRETHTNLRACSLFAFCSNKLLEDATGRMSIPACRKMQHIAAMVEAQEVAANPGNYDVKQSPFQDFVFVDSEEEDVSLNLPTIFNAEVLASEDVDVATAAAAIGRSELVSGLIDSAVADAVSSVRLANKHEAASASATVAVSLPPITATITPYQEDVAREAAFVLTSYTEHHMWMEDIIAMRELAGIHWHSENHGAVCAQTTTVAGEQTEVGDQDELPEQEQRNDVAASTTAPKVETTRQRRQTTMDDYTAMAAASAADEYASVIDLYSEPTAAQPIPGLSEL